MDCVKVRDRFSSFLEKELPPFEESRVREHLSSCPECQKELEQFEKTMRWLHSVGDVEVPDGFLPELYKKMEERKGRGLEIIKAGSRGLSLLGSFKLPVQAVAMVAIVFLVLYLTRMMPMEGLHQKESKQPSSPVLLVEKKSEPVSGQQDLKKEQRAMETLPETPLPKDVHLAKAPVPGEEKLKEADVPQVKAEAKKEEAPFPKTEIMAHQTIGEEDAERLKSLSHKPGNIEKEEGVKEKSPVASKPPHEIVLKISDREKVISQIQELAKQFGGEIVRAEDHMLLASLPQGSVSEFEKELGGLKTDTQKDKALMQKHSPGSFRVMPRESCSRPHPPDSRISFYHPLVLSGRRLMEPIFSHLHGG